MSDLFYEEDLEFHKVRVKVREEYDIAASNQRQSDFFFGCNDGEDRREPRKPDNPDYMRGYNFGSRKWRKKGR